MPKGAKSQSNDHLIQPGQLVFEVLHRGFSVGLDHWRKVPGEEGAYEFRHTSQELGTTAGLHVQQDDAADRLSPVVQITAEQTHDLLKDMNDFDVDVFTAAVELWRQEAGPDSDWVYISFSDILHVAGYKPQRGEGAFRTRERFRVQESVLRLTSAQCYEVPLQHSLRISQTRPDERTQDNWDLGLIRLSPVFLIRDRVGTRIEASTTDRETGRTQQWGSAFLIDGAELQPGPLLAGYLKTSPEEWALLATKALRYRNHIYLVEKRLTRYLGMLYRRRFKPGERSIRASVYELVDVADLPKENPHRPSVAVNRFERAMRRLTDDGVIGSFGWDYENWDGDRKSWGWYDKWLKASVSIAIDDTVYEAYLDQYQKALEAPSDLNAAAGPLLKLVAPSQSFFWTGEAVRSLRQRLGLTQRQFAAELQVSSGQVSLMENGHRSVTDAMAQRLTKLAERKLAELAEQDLPYSGASLEAAEVGD